MRNNDFKYMQYVGERFFDNQFASKREVKSKLDSFDFDKKDHSKNSGGTPLICDGHQGYVDASDTHTLVIGSTGSMKTRAFIIPTITSLGLAGENMVVSDPKGELYMYTSGFLNSLGYKINVLNFRDFDKSDCWNPLHEAYDLYSHGDLSGAKLMINDIAQIFIGNEGNPQDQFWPMAAKDFISGCLSLLFYTAKNEDEVHISSLKSFLVRAYAEKGSSLSMEFINFVTKLPDTSTVKLNLSSSILNADSTKRGVLGHVASNVNQFVQSRDIDRITAKNSINLHEYAKDNSKIITYIIVPDEKSTFNFFCSLFVKQLYEILIKEASCKPHLQLENRVNFILDEFANIPAIPEMSSMISAGRSRNIRFFLVLQSDAQLRKKYGNEEAQNIKTNCQTWCFLNSRETPLINEVLDYVGFDSQNPTKHLLSMSDLSCLSKKWPYVDSIILMNRFRPFVSTLSDISLYSCIFKDCKPIYKPVVKKAQDFSRADYDFGIRITAKMYEDKYFIRDVALKEDPLLSKDLAKLLVREDEDEDFDVDEEFAKLLRHEKPTKRKKPFHKTRR